MFKTTDIGPLLENVDDKSSSKFEDKEKADILQKQFYSVITTSTDNLTATLIIKSDTTLLNLKITEDLVKKRLLKLKVNKSTGPDKILPRFLKELDDYISGPLAIIFEKSMLSGILPRDWKSKYVSLIFKKSNRNVAENYRPISLTSIVCKLMESIFKEYLMSYLTSNNFLSKYQYGFMKNRSTTTQLFSFLDLYCY